jgi:hypothetical protein
MPLYEIPKTVILIFLDDKFAAQEYKYLVCSRSLN